MKRLNEKMSNSTETGPSPDLDPRLSAWPLSPESHRCFPQYIG